MATGRGRENHDHQPAHLTTCRGRGRRLMIPLEDGPEEYPVPPGGVQDSPEDGD
jgi:hypothetical protein